MLPVIPRLTNALPLRVVLNGARLLAAAVLIVPAQSAPSPEHAAIERQHHSESSLQEGCTPDCGLTLPTPFPGRQRALHLARLGVDRWHAAGFRGRGVKIAVLDSGFRGYRDHLGAALPSRVTARSFRHDGNLEAKESQHGILCGEVLHAIAPDAELLFANWEPDEPATFLEAVRWARQQGARAISCSVIMPSWSDGEGSGPVHEALAKLLGNGRQPGDVLFCASAGNTARRHWSGLYRDNGSGFHQWRTGKTDNGLAPWGIERVSVELCWPTAAQYRLEVRDATSSALIRASASRAGRHHSAVVRFLPDEGRTYQVRVRLLQGSPGPFHLVALGGDLEHRVGRGSIPFPADGPEVVAVGAVDAEGERESYSSCGPNSSRPKPNYAALVPFPSMWRSRPFSGTSAASPQVAALAALWWSRQPGWTAEQVRQALRQAAQDLGPPGHDFETGHGLARLPALDPPATTEISLPREAAPNPKQTAIRMR